MTTLDFTILERLGDNDPTVTQITLDADEHQLETRFTSFYHRFLEACNANTNCERIHITWYFLETIRICFRREGINEFMSHLGLKRGLKAVIIGGDTGKTWRQDWNSLEIHTITSLLEDAHQLEILTIDNKGIVILENTEQALALAESIKPPMQKLAIENLRLPLEARKQDILDPLFVIVGLLPNIRELSLRISVRQRSYLMVESVSIDAFRAFLTTTHATTITLKNLGISPQHTLLMKEVLPLGTTIRKLNLNGNRCLRNDGIQDLQDLLETTTITCINANLCGGNATHSDELAILSCLKQAGWRKSIWKKESWIQVIHTISRQTVVNSGKVDVVFSAIYHAVRHSPHFCTCKVLER